MSRFNFVFEGGRNFGKSWLQEQLLKGDVPLIQMIDVVQRYILFTKGVKVKIVFQTFSTPEGVGYRDLDIQLLGRAYDIATRNGFK